MMRLHCAWCEKAGMPAFLGMVPGPEGEISHGICQRHKEELLAEIRNAASTAKRAGSIAEHIEHVDRAIEHFEEYIRVTNLGVARRQRHIESIKRRLLATRHHLEALRALRRRQKGGASEPEAATGETETSNKE